MMGCVLSAPILFGVRQSEIFSSTSLHTHISLGGVFFSVPPLGVHESSGLYASVLKSDLDKQI